MTDPFVTFELISPDELEIHGNKAGLEYLGKMLARVIESRDHEHLLSRAWGGDVLSDENQRAESKVMHKVTIHIW